MNLAECRINPIYVNFHLQKSLEIFDKNSADKIWSKNYKEIKVSPLMPIRVNVRNFGTIPSYGVYIMCSRVVTGVVGVVIHLSSGY